MFVYFLTAWGNTCHEMAFVERQKPNLGAWLRLCGCSSSCACKHGNQCLYSSVQNLVPTANIAEIPGLGLECGISEKADVLLCMGMSLLPQRVSLLPFLFLAMPEVG